MKPVYVRTSTSSTRIHRTEDIAPGVQLDYDADGNLIGVEILSACEVQIAGKRRWSDTQHEFEIILRDIHLTQAMEDALFEAGCDDATLCQVGRDLHLSFSRDSRSLQTAIDAALQDLSVAGFVITKTQWGSDKPHLVTVFAAWKPDVNT